MVVFFDIDGTIIDDETQIIPESAKRAVEQLGKNGHLAVVNTGRPFSHIDPRVREMVFGGWICGCGMDVRANGERLFYRTPTAEQCRFIVEAARECGMATLFESDDGSIVLDSTGPMTFWANREKERMLAKGFSVFDLADHPGYMKMVTWDVPGCQRQRFIDMVAPEFHCFHRENRMLEVVPSDCTKAMGMERLLAALGLPRQETLAIGDSTNDVPMFQFAAHTVCMGGGMEELKQQTEYITATVMEDGIEKALKHYGLI